MQLQKPTPETDSGLPYSSITVSNGPAVRQGIYEQSLSSHIGSADAWQFLTPSSDTTRESNRTPASVLASSTITSANEDGHSIFGTSLATVTSSRSSLDDPQAAAFDLEKDQAYTDCSTQALLCAQGGLFEPHNQSIATAVSAEEGYRNVLNENTINSRSLSVADILPTIQGPTPSKYKTSPVCLLLNFDLLQTSTDPVTVSDLEQIEELGDFLSEAQSHEDSFSIFRIFTTQVTAQQAEIAQIFRLMLQGAVHLTKNATTREDRSQVIELLKTFTPKTLKFNSDFSIQGCLLYSYLGNGYRLEGNMALAEKYCNLALKNYRLLDVGLRRPGYQAIILEHLILMESQRKVKDWEDQSLDLRIAKLQKMQFGLPDWKEKHDFNKALVEVFHWCSAHLFHEPFVKEIQQANEALWMKAPSNEQLADFLATLLFSYLWKRLYDEKPSGGTKVILGAHRPAFVDIHNICGIRPIETLSVIARMVIANVSSFAQHGLAGAIAGAAKNIEEQRRPCSMEVFIDVYVAPLRRTFPRFSDQVYTSLVQTHLRYFIEKNFDLQLSESSFQDSRMRQQLFGGSFIPACTATMLSTPHSSWSGLKSTTSLSKRISSMFRNSGEFVQGITTSNPHWSGRSVLSMATSASWRFSARFSSRRSSTMDVDKESLEKMKNTIDQTYISAPTLVWTTNPDLTAAGYPSAYASSRKISHNEDDLMDID